MNNLPQNWTKCRLGDVIRLKNGYAFKSSDYSDHGMPLVRISDIKNGRVFLNNTVKIPEAKAKLDFIIEPGDFLIAMSGATTGKTGVYKGKEPCLQNQRVGNFKLISEDVVDEGYRNYYIASLRKTIEALAYGGAQPNISSKEIESLDFPLAPLNEQQLIVAEIEKQFSRLDEAVAALKRIQANLKRYKASVLKAAVEGKLTEQWRKEHPDVEPASNLLKSILAERKKKWEEKHPGKKYKEPVSPDTSNLSELPEGWVWASFDQVSTRVTVGHVGPMKNEYVDSGIPFLRSQNVRENRFDSEGLKFISQEFHKKLQKSALQPGDLVVVRSGSVGVACVIPEVLKEANCSDLVIVKQSHGILPQFGAYYMNSIIKTRVAAKRVGVALTHFNTQSMAFMPIPVPPLSEQLKIIEKVESRVSVAEEIEIYLEVNLKRAERLRQSILKKAFEGRLVMVSDLPTPIGDVT